MLHSNHTFERYWSNISLDMLGLQPSIGGFLMKPDIGAIADVLSDVLELIEMLRGDVLQMMEDSEE